MATDQTIRIENVQELKDRLRSAQVLTNWKRFSDFLVDFVHNLESSGENPNKIAEIGGQKFPLDLATLRYLYTYLGSSEHFQPDFKDEPALGKIQEVIAATKRKYGSALEGANSNDPIGRQRNAALSFYRQLIYDLDSVNLQSETSSEAVDLPDAIAAVFGNNQDLLQGDDPSEVNRLKVQITKQFSELQKIIEKYEKPERISLETQVQTALSAQETLAAQDDDEAKRIVKRTEEMRGTAQDELSTSLKEAGKEQLNAIQNSQALLHTLVDKYSKNSPFEEQLVAALLPFIRTDRLDFTTIFSFTPFLGYLNNLFTDLLGHIKDLTEKKTEAYQKAQKAAKKSLNQKLANLFDVELPQEDDAGGGADEEIEDKDVSFSVQDFRTQLTDIQTSLDSLPHANVDVLKSTLAIDAIQNLKQIRIVIEYLSQEAGSFTDSQRKNIISRLTAHISALEAEQEKDEEPTEPESQPDSVPQVTLPAAATDSQEEKISKLRAGSELARLNALLVAQAEGQLFVRLQELGYSEEKAEELIAAYHGDLTNLIWTELLGAGGYALLKGQETKALGAVELTQIWANATQIVGNEILVANGGAMPTNYGGNYASPEEIALLTQKTRLAVEQAGFVDADGSLTSLTGALTFFQTPEGLQQILQLSKSAELVNAIQQQSGISSDLINLLRSIDSAEGIEQLLRFDPEALKQLSRAQRSDINQKLQRFIDLHTQIQEVGFLPPEELAIYNELAREIEPIFNILNEYGDDLYLILYAQQDLENLAQFIQRAAQTEAAVQQRLPEFVQRDIQYRSQFTQYAVVTTTVTTTTVTTVETEQADPSYLLGEAKNDIALKRLIALSLAASPEEQMELELLLRHPEMSGVSDAANAEGLPPLNQLNQQNISRRLAALQQKNSGLNQKIEKAKALQAGMKALIASKGNPYLLAANLLKSKEGRKLIMKALGGAAVGAAATVAIILAPLIQFYNAVIVPVMNFVSGAISGITGFFGGLFGGGGAAAASSGISGSLGAGTAQAMTNAATSAKLASTQASAFARGEAAKALTGLEAQANAIMSGTIVAETATAVIAVGIIGPFMLIGILTLIVITVIGASVNDIPMSGVQRSISGGGLGVAGCWPADGTITALETYQDGSPHVRRDSPGASAIDIGGPTGSPIYTPFSGNALSQWHDEYGNMVKIETDYGFTVILAHMLEACVPSQTGGCLASGQTAPITAGQQVGVLGNTGNSSGPHLHYEVYNVPSSLTTHDYAIADLVPSMPPLALGAVVSTSECSVGGNPFTSTATESGRTNGASSEE